MIKKTLLLNFAFCLMFQVASFAQNLNRKAYDGLISGAAAIRVILTFDGDAVFGTLKHKDTGVTNKVIGFADLTGVFFYEFKSNGDVLATYTARVKDDGKLRGVSLSKWSDFQEERSLTLSKITHNVYNRKPIASYTGTYVFQLSSDLGRASMQVEQVGRDKVTIAIHGLSGSPLHSDAIIKKKTIQLTGNRAYYVQYGYDKCKLKINFTEQGATVDFYDNGTECGFGAGATVRGMYLKISDEKPIFKKVL